jgi:hypothetical protein
MAKKHAWQSRGKGRSQRTTKKAATATAHAFAVHEYYAVRRVVSCTVKEPLPCGQPFAVRKITFLFFHFYFIIFNIHVYFSISFIFC